MGRFDEVRQLRSTASTNADILELGRQGAHEGLVIVADVQTAGRGRHGRTWVAPPRSGMLCSALLRPPSRVVELVTAAVAVAACDATDALGAVGVGIKWPNDVIAVVDRRGEGPQNNMVERKLAGILAEADWSVGSSPSDGYRIPAPDEKVLVAAGIGMNVARVSGPLEQIAERRVCLEELLEKPIALETVRDEYLAALERRYDELLADPETILHAWKERCVSLGRRVRVDLVADEIEGTAADIDDHGRLIVRTADGVDHAVSAGDVHHLRDAL